DHRTPRCADLAPNRPGSATGVDRVRGPRLMVRPRPEKPAAPERPTPSSRHAVIDWLLGDYGEVLSRALPESTFAELAAISDLQRDEFRERYWRYRPDYDRGQTPLHYWSAVLDRDLTRQRRRVERLTAVDVNGWTRLNSPTLRTTLNPPPRPHPP